MSIPPHKTSGTLPPYVGTPTRSSCMAPYRVSLPEVVARFATSEARRDILRGYLRHRAALREYGLTGVQYIDGSFIDKMAREPNDIDVITFYIPPTGFDATAAKAERPDVFDRHISKHAFRCDAQFIDISQDPIETLDLTRFWYGLFSHTRDGEWRGLLHVPLTLEDDIEAAQMFDSMGGP